MKRHIGLHYINHPKHLFFTLALFVGGVLGGTYSVQAYPEIFKTDILIDKKTDVRPDSPVTINFSNPVFINNYSNTRVVNKESSSGSEEKIRITWENSNRKMLIYPQTFWKLESQYEVILPQGKNKMFIKVNADSFDFSTSKFPKVKSVLPIDGAKDVVLEIEDPITVNFDKSLEDFSVKFVLTPKEDLTYQSNKEKNQFKLLPKEKIKEGTSYAIKVYIKYINDKEENYKEIFSSSFTTKPPPPTVWEKDFTLRLEQAKKYTPAKITSGKYVDINLAQQILCSFESGNLLDCYLVSTGKRGMETPKGQFAIRNKAARVWSKKYGLYMPYWNAVASDGSFGIHELPEWPGGYKEGASHLGIPVSHGCIRLGVGPAKIIFDWADIGIPVVIY